MAEASRKGGKLNVFISYSRIDMVFADRLVAALEGRGFTCLIDRRDLEYGEEWQAVLRDLIEKSDTVVFVVSPRSINSQWCRWEMAEVSKLSKRLVPLVIDQVTPELLPPEIGAIHLMPFGASIDFDEQVVALDTVLMTDRGWVQEHTRLSGIALKWHVGERKRDSLLRGTDLAEAQTWKSRPTRTRLPLNPLVEALISESRANEIRLQRTRMRIATVIAVSAIALSAVAGWQWLRATQSQQEAVAEAETVATEAPAKVKA